MTLMYLVEIIGASPFGIRGNIQRDVTPTCKECWTIGAREIPELLSSNLKANNVRMFHLLSDSKADQQHGESVSFRRKRKKGLKSP